MNDWLWWLPVMRAGLQLVGRRPGPGRDHGLGSLEARHPSPCCCSPGWRRSR
ncbi:hypothetical protein QJS66_17835 [Kocuria rhizophila]|nr:hypothetical protein QJS66_17835 [Kocuria rhizophila]